MMKSALMAMLMLGANTPEKPLQAKKPVEKTVTYTIQKEVPELIVEGEEPEGATAIMWSNAEIGKDNIYYTEMYRNGTLGELRLTGYKNLTIKELWYTAKGSLLYNGALYLTYEIGTEEEPAERDYLTPSDKTPIIEWLGFEKHTIDTANVLEKANRGPIEVKTDQLNIGYYHRDSTLQHYQYKWTIVYEMIEPPVPQESKPLIGKLITDIKNVVSNGFKTINNALEKVGELFYKNDKFTHFAQFMIIPAASMVFFYLIKKIKR